ncbi:hypothetical protein GCM10009599_11550 [Luteococcus peritonei]
MALGELGGAFGAARADCMGNGPVDMGEVVGETGRHPPRSGDPPANRAVELDDLLRNRCSHAQSLPLQAGREKAYDSG